MTSERDIPGANLVRTFDLAEGPIGRVAWSASGTRLAVPASMGRVLVLDVASGDLVRAVKVGQQEAGVAAFHPRDDARLATCGADNPVKLWNLKPGQRLRTIPSRSGGNDLVFAGGGLLISAHDAGVHMWSIESGHERQVEFPLSETQPTSHRWCIDARGRMFAHAGHTLNVRDLAEFDRPVYTARPSKPLLTVSMHPSRALVAAGGTGPSLTIHDWQKRREIAVLEGHTSPVRSVAFLRDGALLASLDQSGEVLVWETRSWRQVACIEASGPGFDDGWMPALAGQANGPCLAVPRRTIETGARGDHSRWTVEVWELDDEALKAAQQGASLAYSSAKIVLVGDSGVGKTGLGWRLAHGRFKQHASTHGQQFWMLDDVSATRTDGMRCEAILWDLAGQADYRLIHAMFLDDTDLALVLFDPTRDDDPLRGVEYWLKQLNHTGGRPIILVSARSDRGSARLTAHDIAAFCARWGLAGSVSTSAFTGDGLEELVISIRAAIDWDRRPTTITTTTFKWVKDFVLELKERGGKRVILRPDELRQRLVAWRPDWVFSNAEMLTAVQHLANHGYVVSLTTSTGETRVLLAPELLNNLAASIVLEARRNQRGLGTLEEQRLLDQGYELPELTRLDEDEREVLIDSAVAIFLAHNICFRETDPLSARTYLVFPELINLKKPVADDAGSFEEGVAYTVTGASTNVYASLVVLLGYTNTFTRTNQWRGQAQYVIGDGKVCGFRLENERASELDFVLYFGHDVGGPLRTLFQGLFESFLARQDLTVRRFEPVTCSKGHRLNRAAVREQLDEGSDHAFCIRCGEKLGLRRPETPVRLTQSVREEGRIANRRSAFEQALFRVKAYVTQEEIEAPECFVSYAWGDPDHERWVEQDLATDLLKAGADVVLDRWENTRIGASVPRFVERARSADRVIVVGTPDYRRKYDNQEPMRGYVVAAEGDLIGGRMIGSEAGKERILPVLRDGEAEAAFPPLLHHRVYADLRDGNDYFAGMLSLVLSVFGIARDNPVHDEVWRLLGR